MMNSLYRFIIGKIIAVCRQLAHCEVHMGGYCTSSQNMSFYGETSLKGMIQDLKKKKKGTGKKTKKKDSDIVLNYFVVIFS